MVTLHAAELAISAITFFIAYLIVSTISNVFRTYVAYKMGDDTGEMLGYSSLNPFVHVDPFGIICLFLFHLGWGKTVPVNHHNINEPHKGLKLACIYLSDVFIRFLLSIAGIICLLAIFDVRILSVVKYMILTYDVSQLYIAKIYPHVSSFAVSLGFIIFAIVYLGVVLGVLNFIINICNYLFLILSEKYRDADQYGNYVTIGLPIILILFFSGWFRLIAVNMIGYVGLGIAYMCGIA